MRVRVVRMSKYAVVALGSIILVRPMVGWRVGLIPVFRTWCSETRTPRVCTGKLVLNQGFPSQSGGMRIRGGRTGEGYRVRAERSDSACLLAYSWVKETSCWC